MSDFYDVDAKYFQCQKNLRLLLDCPDSTKEDFELASQALLRFAAQRDHARSDDLPMLRVKPIRPFKSSLTLLDVMFLWFSFLGACTVVSILVLSIYLLLN
jgi:hypothetical protein